MTRLLRKVYEFLCMKASRGQAIKLLALVIEPCGLSRGIPTKNQYYSLCPKRINLFRTVLLLGLSCLSVYANLPQISKNNISNQLKADIRKHEEVMQRTWAQLTDPKLFCTMLSFMTSVTL